MGKKNLAIEYYKAPPFDVILDPGSWKGHWHERFGREAPLHVEIGMGLGKHLVEYAASHPEMDHIGLELKMHRIYTARHKALRLGIRNVRFVPGDAIKALDAFADGEVSRLTLLFPDPWAKNEQRRLTHPKYVASYRRILAPGGVLHFRTDDPPLFAYSMQVLAEMGFELHTAVEVDRIMTDFERRWLEEGRQIYGVDAVKPG